MTSHEIAKSFTVLIADDEPSGRYVKTRLLTRHGYAVVEAANGREALTIAAEIQPHVVLLDTRLPDISGYQVCHELKSHPRTKDIMVLQTSAVHVSSLDRMKGIASGADAYLVEPAEEEEIVCAVRALVRLAEQARVAAPTFMTSSLHSRPFRNTLSAYAWRWREVRWAPGISIWERG